MQGTLKFKTDIIAFFKRQLNNIKKPDLKDLLLKLKSDASTIGAKNDLIDQISNQLFNKIIQLKNNSQNYSIIINWFKNWFDKETQSGLNSNKIQTLQSIFKGQNNQNIQTTKNNKNYKITQQTIIVSNVWTQNKKQKYPCICPNVPSNLISSKFDVQCYKCKKYFHINCLWGRLKEDTLPQCPACYLINCFPHKKVQKVLFAGYLTTSKINKIIYKINFQIPQSLKILKKIHFQVRCTRFESQNNRYQITWPDRCSITFNKNKIYENKPMSKLTSLKRRGDEQIMLQKADLNRIDQQQQLIIEQKHQYDSQSQKYEFSNHYIMILALVNQQHQKIIDTFKKSVLSTSQSKQTLKKYLLRNQGNQGDITIEKFSIKLNCPFSSNKISIPVRTIHCSTHFQPFDLRNFIILNKDLKVAAQKYKCPICKKRAYDLLIDQYILSLINSRKSIQNIQEIQFSIDGQPIFEQVGQISDQESQQQANRIQQQIPKKQNIQNQTKNQSNKKLNSLQNCSFQDLDIDKDQNLLNNQINGNEKNQKQVVYIDLQEYDQPQKINQQPKNNKKQELQIQEQELRNKEMKNQQFSKIINIKQNSSQQISNKLKRQCYNPQVIIRNNKIFQQDQNQTKDQLRKIVNKNLSQQKKHKFLAKVSDYNNNKQIQNKNNLSKENQHLENNNLKNRQVLNIKENINIIKSNINSYPTNSLGQIAKKIISKSIQENQKLYNKFISQKNHQKQDKQKIISENLKNDEKNSNTKPNYQIQVIEIISDEQPSLIKTSKNNSKQFINNLTMRTFNKSSNNIISKKLQIHKKDKQKQKQMNRIVQKMDLQKSQLQDQQYEYIYEQEQQDYLNKKINKKNNQRINKLNKIQVQSNNLIKNNKGNNLSGQSNLANYQDTIYDQQNQNSSQKNNLINEKETTKHNSTIQEFNNEYQLRNNNEKPKPQLCNNYIQTQTSTYQLRLTELRQQIQKLKRKFELKQQKYNQTQLITQDDQKLFEQIVDNIYRENNWA